ncbi:hypothetical protein ABNX05_07575 [Lysinibacillus sp. M3]|uniref:N-acetyl-gamma-glutamyl-phosphate reductase dimerisation domain-containing protein n=1 Tax=Lysinibacillus zambalensis TaxID=3160866 RepID=A0ABV1MQU6_9BACI
MIDAKSGISGAGNKPSQTTHFSETNESLSIYKTNAHQHIPEIEQAISMFTGVDTTISFSLQSVAVMLLAYMANNRGVTSFLSIVKGNCTIDPFIFSCLLFEETFCTVVA